MCLIVLAIRSHPRYKLIIAANRDEYYRRPTAAAGFWADYPAILGGNGPSPIKPRYHISLRLASLSNNVDFTYS